MSGIQGYVRPVGPAGARNHVLVLPSVVCSALVAGQIAEAAGATSVTHQHGCGHIGADITQTRSLFIGLAANPNVARSLVVSLGCETVQGNAVAAELVRLGFDTRFVGIQKAGGNDAARDAGIRQASDLVDAARRLRRAEVDSADLTLGLAVSRTDPRVAELITAVVRRRGRVVIAGADVPLPPLPCEPAVISIGDEPTAPVSVIRNAGIGGAQLLAALVASRAQVLVEFAADDQPPLGFPLAPVLAVAAPGGLHAVLGEDFDLAADADADAVLAAADTVFSGASTKAERRNAGTFAIPRLMRTM